MGRLSGRATDLHRALSVALGALFFAATTLTSYDRWRSYQYRTFDLAYYVQAIWQLIHGRFAVSVENVPLLGNHVEPIVLLIAPIFFFARHPMVFVFLQNAAIASMGPVGFDVARRLGLSKANALLLAAALLAIPATGYIALHEFHPEALAAPFLLLMLRARLIRSSGQYWLWFLATLACKENMALLLAAYCIVQCIAERRTARIRTWYLAPFTVAILWFVIASKLITPLLNSGNIDYLALYQRLGNSPREILLNFVRQPQLVIGSFWHGLTNGNLVWALLAPFCFLPLLRPKWLLIAAPIFLQHLLSWRPSEWTIYFHYAAPLVPLLWFATAEASAALRRWFAPAAVLSACTVAQLVLGPATELDVWPRVSPAQAEKDAFVRQIPADASVAASLPYLSHLAMRRELYSLHYVLKGLKTLSRERFVPPPPPDYVLIDYSNSATFDTRAGYYHPTMRTTTGEIIPASDALLHEYLQRATWGSRAVNALTLLHNQPSAAEKPPPHDATTHFDFGGGAALLDVARETSGDAIEIITTWHFDADRTVFPWLELQVTNIETGQRHIFTRGLCAPEVGAGVHYDRWRNTQIGELPRGRYSLEARFFEQSTRRVLGVPIPLGDLELSQPQR